MLERGCRAVALGSLGVLLWRAWHPAPRPERPLVGETTRALPGVLAQGTRRPVAALDLSFDSIPGAREREWARALAGAGTLVRWRLAQRDTVEGAVARAHPATYASLTAEPLVDPSGRLRIVVRGPTGATFALADAAGSIDSSRLGASEGRVLDATASGRIALQLPTSVASTARRDSVVLRPVLVLANAGWEAKFVVAALEEAGWRVDARFSVAPQVAVRQGEGPIDTARYAAVIALDRSAAAQGAAIARFVRNGGGAIVTASAATIPALAPLLPARIGTPVVGTIGALAGDQPKRGLGGNVLVSLTPTAVALDRSAGAMRIAAGRVELGRVVLLGYDETWRWRMEGGDGAPGAHRAWWSALVASVAHAPLVPLGDVPAVDEAPYAALRAALGTPSSDLAAADLAPDSRSDTLLLALLLGALLAEWTSRRLRGAR
jgi:hypothetical protein